jgi:hypothetical protein
MSLLGSAGGARWVAARLAAAVAVVLWAGCAATSDAGREAVVVASDAYDAETGEVLLALDAVELPAHTGHHSVDQPRARATAVPVSGWLHGYSVELVDAHGRPVPREVLHHVNILRADRRELFSTIMQRVGAAGAETDDVRLPRILGYPVEKGDSLIVIAEFHNPTPVSFEGVQLRVRMPHTQPGDWPTPVRVYPFYIDVTPPAAPHGFDLPPGRSEASWEGRPAVSGRILGMGGHLHTHAVELRLEDVTEGEVIWRTEPMLDAAGELVGMPQSRLWWRLGLPVRADHVYRLTAVYDNPTGAALPEGGMGALGGIIVPSGEAIWPSVDRSDEVYAEDYMRRVANRGGRSQAAGAHGGHQAH